MFLKILSIFTFQTNCHDNGFFKFKFLCGKTSNHSFYFAQLEIYKTVESELSVLKLILGSRASN